MTPTYLQRVQQVLSDRIKDEKSTILFEELVRRVRRNTERGGVRCGPRYRLIIQSVVKRESRARRLGVEHHNNIPLVRLTPSGIRFYKEWGVFPLYKEGDYRLHRMTIAQIEQHSKKLHGVLTDIQLDCIAAYPEYTVDAQDIGSLPDVVQEILASLAELQYPTF